LVKFGKLILLYCFVAEYCVYVYVYFLLDININIIDGNTSYYFTIVHKKGRKVFFCFVFCVGTNQFSEYYIDMY